MIAIATQTPHVGELLRGWRQRRNLSQFQLATGSAVSARHLSFIETGRARPSREMVLHLAERLEVALRDRNGLLLAAGYAPVYGERSLDAEEMAPVREALDRFLEVHEPYPAVVVDRHWNLVAANQAIGLLVEGVDPELLASPANALRVTLHPRGMAARIVNIAEWSAHLLERLRRQADASADEELRRLYDELAAYPNVSTEPPPAQPSGADILLPLRMRTGGSELAFFSTVTTFGTPTDVTLAELAIEAFYPANAETSTALLSAARRSE